MNPKVLEKVKQTHGLPVWIENAKTAVGHPNETDIKELVEVVKSLWMFFEYGVTESCHRIPADFPIQINL